MTIRLDPNPSRTLTSREATQILSGNFGTIVQLAGVDNALAALNWLHANQAEAVRVLQSGFWVQDEHGN